MNCNKKVSILICAYNAGHYLIPSLKSAYAQTYPNIEVILVDDGSTDESVSGLPVAIAEDRRLTVIRQKNRGKANALNNGLQKCTGVFVAIQDADDISLPTRVAEQVNAFEKDPRLDLVFCGHYLIIDGVFVAPVSQPKTSEACRLEIAGLGMPGHDPTIMFRRELINEYLYDEDLVLGEGHDFILRVGEKRCVENIGSALYGYRFHLESLTKKDPLKRTRMIARVLEKACLRRGANFRERFPHLCSEEGICQVAAASPLNDTLSHFVISVQCSLRCGRRIEALKLVTWMARRWPRERETYKAAALLLMPRVLLKRRAEARREVQAKLYGA
jgi:glycosyltransferase involved in cell wall biosynthesis